jgi:hypothetical protein
MATSDYYSARKHPFCHRSEIKLLPEARNIATITTTTFGERAMLETPILILILFW